MQRFSFLLILLIALWSSQQVQAEDGTCPSLNKKVSIDLEEPEAVESAEEISDDEPNQDTFSCSSCASRRSGTPKFSSVSTKEPATELASTKVIINWILKILQYYIRLFW